MKTKNIRPLLLISLSLISTSAFAVEQDYLPYEKFISEVEAGSIKSVKLDRFSQITGVHIVNGKEQEFRSYGETGTANDVLLTRLLKQKSINTSIEEKKERNVLLDSGVGILLFLIPIITLVMTFVINSKLKRLKPPVTEPAA